VARGCHLAVSLLACALLAGCAVTVNTSTPTPAPVQDSVHATTPAAPTARTPPSPPAETPRRPATDWAALQHELETALPNTPGAHIDRLAPGLRLSLPAADGFASGNAIIQPPLAAQLQRIAPIFSRHQGPRIHIIGHTDGAGSEMYNLRLSIQRAETVMEHLRRLGIAPERMSADGHGESKPIADNRTAEGRTRNRRVEILLEPR
jgi:outer membrane protein OmpA-like peptidoglycan-associated protein